MVSYLFLVIGLLALAEMVLSTVKGTFHFNFGILGIGIFAGLRRYSKIWRTCAIAFTWYGIVTLSISLVVCLYGPASATLGFIGPIEPADWLSIPLVMVLLLTLWQYRILTHPAIRRLFNELPHPVLTAATSPAVAEVGGVVLKQ
jgi:hypothetical protein